MDKICSEGLEITLEFSYIREFMLASVGKLLEKVDNWCCIHGVNVEIVVNDWAMMEMLCGKTSRLRPVLGTLLNKRKKDPRMKYKSGDTSLFQQNTCSSFSFSTKFRSIFPFGIFDVKLNTISSPKEQEQSCRLSVLAKSPNL